MKINEIVSKKSNNDNEFGDPKKVLIRHMTKNGFKSMTVNGGSYGYTTTLDQLSKPKIKWFATDGSEFNTDTIKEISEWMDDRTDWDDFWERENTKDADLTDIRYLEDMNVLVFSKTLNPRFKGQEDWETAKIKGDI